MRTIPALADDRHAPAGFAPETVLPCQLLDTSHRGAAMQPEKRLVLAVLEDALATLQRTAGRTNRAAMREHDEVRAWLASDDTSWPYAFQNVCHVLGYEPDYLRNGLRTWLDAGRARSGNGTVVPIRHAFRRISGSRTRAVVPRRLRHA